MFVNTCLFLPYIVKDLSEIILLSCALYWFLRWLKQDQHKPLIGYFYAYALFWGICYLAHLKTVSYMLEQTLFPVIMFFILVHQRTLQKNFISLQKIEPARSLHSDWLHEVVRFCLQAEHDVYLLIEHADRLEDLVTVSVPIETQITTSLLQFLDHCPDVNHEQYMLLNTQGTLHGINVHWKKPLALYDINNNELVKASYYIMDNDAFVVQYHYEHRLFSVVMRDTIYQNLTTAQLLQSVSHYLSSITKGTHHEAYSSEHHQQQPHA